MLRYAKLLAKSFLGCKSVLSLAFFIDATKEMGTVYVFLQHSNKVDKDTI